MRERLIELLQESRNYAHNIMLHSDVEDVADTSAKDLQVDYLLKNGVVVLLKDGNDFNDDLYCPYCGYILSDTGIFPKEEAEKALEKGETE